MVFKSSLNNGGGGGGGGTVTSITSSDNSLTITDPTTTPDIIINLDNPIRWRSVVSFGNKIVLESTIEGTLTPDPSGNFNVGQPGSEWNNVYANFFWGDGSHLTGVPASDLASVLAVGHDANNTIITNLNTITPAGSYADIGSNSSPFGAIFASSYVQAASFRAPSGSPSDNIKFTDASGTVLLESYFGIWYYKQGIDLADHNIDSVGLLRFGNFANDVGISRNTSGVLEVNNGTSGTYRDLILFDLTCHDVNFNDSLNGPKVTSANAYWVLSDNANGHLGLALSSAYGIAWTSTSSWGDAADLGLNRNASGVLEVNNGSSGSYRDIIARAMDLNGNLNLNGHVGTAYQWDGSVFSLGGIADGLWNASLFNVLSSAVIGWSAPGPVYANPIDTALGRNAAGVVEINNGTPGTYGDLQARNANLSGLTASKPVFTDGSKNLVSGPSSAIPYTLFDHYASVGNVGTGEDDLYSDTIAAGKLASNGDKLAVEYGGVFVSSATATRELKAYFGGTMIFDTGALTLSLSSAWTMYVTIIRVSATVIRYMVSLSTEGAGLSAYTAVGEVTGLTLSGTNILKITGESAGVGAATNDIVAMLGTVIYQPAA